MSNFFLKNKKKTNINNTFWSHYLFLNLLISFNFNFIILYFYFIFWLHPIIWPFYLLWSLGSSISLMDSVLCSHAGESRFSWWFSTPRRSSFISFDIFNMHTHPYLWDDLYELPALIHVLTQTLVYLCPPLTIWACGPGELNLRLYILCRYSFIVHPCLFGFVGKFGLFV